MYAAGARAIRSSAIDFTVNASSLTSTGTRSPVTNAVSLRPVSLIVSVSLIAALLLIATVRPPWSVASAITLAVLALAAEVDRRELRLPDALVGLAAVPPLFVLAAGPAFGRAEIVTGVLTGAAVAGLPVAALHLVNPAAMGFGDVKAAAVLGAAVGVIEWRLALVALCLAAGVAAVSCAIGRRPAVAFGPFLVGGAVAVLVAARLVPPEVFPWR